MTYVFSHSFTYRTFQDGNYSRYFKTLKNGFQQKEHRRLAVFRLGALTGSLLTRPLL